MTTAFINEIETLTFNKEEQYILADTIIIRKSDNAFIPTADGNRDYEEYKAWHKAGGVPVEYEEKIDMKAKLVAQLKEIDDNYRTQRTIAQAALGEEKAISRLKEAEKLAEKLRNELMKLS